ncbi:hypothetical protein ACKKBG_A10770 [Auxenochlorella protothecoides x Auxenochlorella symbiontica]
MASPRVLIFAFALALASSTMAVPSKLAIVRSCGNLHVTASWSSGLCANIVARSTLNETSTSWAALLSVSGITITSGPTGIGAPEMIDSETWAILPIDGTQQKIQAKNTITINFCGVTDAPEEVVASLETVFGHGPNFTTQDAANKLSSGYCPFLPVVSPPPPPHHDVPAPAPESDLE